MQPQRTDLVIVGRLWAEHVACAPVLPKPAETVSATTFEEMLGGRGARQAAAAVRLGASVGFVASVNRDARADRLLGWLVGEGVDPRLVRRDAGAFSGAALVQVDGHGARQAMVFPDAALSLSPLDVEAAASSIGAARVLLVSLELPREVAQRAVGLAGLDGVRVVLDAVGATSVSPELLAVDVVHAGVEEARALTGIEVVGAATAGAAAELLLQRGPRAVVIEAGGDGHLVVTSSGSRLFPRIGAPIADEAVADEAFVAALAVGLAEGRPLDAAGTLASAARALVSAEPGVRAFPRRDAVMRLLEATTGRSWEVDEAA